MVRRATQHGCSDREFVPLASPLDELDQHAVCRAGVQKGHAGVVGAFADQRFENLHPGRLRLFYSDAQVGGGETDVMNAGAMSLEEASNCRFVVQGFEQFQTAGPIAEESHAHPFGGNFVVSRRVLSEQRSEDGDGFRQGIDGDSDVVDTVHDISFDGVRRAGGWTANKDDS